MVAHMWQVTLDRARQYPGPARSLTVSMSMLGASIERLVDLKPGVVVAEVFFLDRIDEGARTVSCSYQGLRRLGALMSFTEKRLSPSRFPA